MLRPILTLFGSAARPYAKGVALAFLAVAVIRLGRYMGWW